jgi:hypothetical protein
VGEVKGFESMVGDGKRDVGGHGEVSGGCHDGKDTADTVHDSDHIGQSEVSASQPDTSRAVDERPEPLHDMRAGCVPPKTMPPTRRKDSPDKGKMTIIILVLL